MDSPTRSFERVVGTSRLVHLGSGSVPRVRGKRAFDVFASLVGLAAASPALIVIALIVKASSRGPIIYRGVRVGRDGRDFQILKFRTMWHRETSQLTTSHDDPRVTRVGSWLRRYKLDELPQLVNVLRGDMSVVGPRPEFRQWVDRYESADMVALAVRPGLTDFASLEFIDLHSLVGSEDADARYLSEALPRKNELRRRYVAEMSWRTDLKLIGRTLQTIAFRR